MCKLVGLYLLHQIKVKLPELNTGLYRDDGLGCLCNASGPMMDKARKKMIQIFKNNGLSITIETNLAVTDFLDVKLDLTQNSFQPFSKPNSEPLYINRKSNHPRSIIKQIPSMIEQRLSTLSSSEKSSPKQSNGAAL